MNIKRWFAWACLALMLVAEIFLFQANREKDAALLSLRDTQAQLRETRRKTVRVRATDVAVFHRGHRIYACRLNGSLIASGYCGRNSCLMRKHQFLEAGRNRTMLSPVASLNTLNYKPF